MKTMVRKSKLITPEVQHTRHSRVIIDLEAIRLNYQFLKSTVANSKVIAVIKADAYGHGAIQVAKTLVNADAFAVATVMEAIELRDAGIQQKIIADVNPADYRAGVHVMSHPDGSDSVQS